MRLLNNVQINQISGSAGNAFAVTGSTALFFALYFYYTQKNESVSAFEKIEERVSKLELLVSAQAEQLALLTGSNQTNENNIL